jgi:hypothetical protein
MRPPIGGSGAISRTALRFLGLFMLSVRGEAAGLCTLSTVYDNQHEEPEGSMEDITTKSAGSGIGGPAEPNNAKA